MHRPGSACIYTKRSIALFAGFSGCEAVAFFAGAVSVLVGAAKQYVQWQDDNSAIPAVWIRDHYDLLSVGPQ